MSYDHRTDPNLGAPEAVPPERTPETWRKQVRTVFYTDVHPDVLEHANEVADALWPLVRADLVRAATTAEAAPESDGAAADLTESAVLWEQQAASATGSFRDWLLARAARLRGLAVLVAATGSPEGTIDLPRVVEWVQRQVGEWKDKARYHGKLADEGGSSQTYNREEAQHGAEMADRFNDVLAALRSSAPAPATEPSEALATKRAAVYNAIRDYYESSGTEAEAEAAIDALIAAALGSSAPAPGGGMEDAEKWAAIAGALLTATAHRVAFKPHDFADTPDLGEEGQRLVAAAANLAQMMAAHRQSMEPLRSADRTREDAGEPGCSRLEAARQGFYEGFNAGIGAGHDLSSPRERDVAKQWEQSDVRDVFAPGAASPSPRHGTREDGPNG